MYAGLHKNKQNEAAHLRTYLLISIYTLLVTVLSVIATTPGSENMIVYSRKD